MKEGSASLPNFTQRTLSRLDTLATRIPADFRLGTATSSWQIEGSSHLRGRSIWDDFAAIPGNIIDGAGPDPACDHINLWERDLDLLTWLGVDSYRFSVSWPRILREGVGKVDEAGLAFYDRLIDGLLKRNIEPVITLYHWDLPSALEAKGGWNWTGIGDAFAEYTEVLAKKFSDRIAMWSTFNEPWCSAFLGYADKVMAPGKANAAAGFEAAYRLLTAHAKSVEVLRANNCKNVGIVLNLTTFIAEDAGVAAAAHHMDGIMNRIWLDPLAGRGIPSDLIESTTHLTDWSFVDAEDLKKVAAPIDWLGINYYTPTRIASTPDAMDRSNAVGSRPDAFPGTPPVFFVPRPPLTKMGWEVHPESLTQTLLTTWERFPSVPIYITENGGAFPDETLIESNAEEDRNNSPRNSTIDDQDRVEYFEGHVEAVLNARDAGVDIRGYFAWSLLDNLEWAEGWTKRFGIVQVDPDTQVRTPKKSAYFFRELIARRNRKRTLPTTSL